MNARKKRKPYKRRNNLYHRNGVWEWRKKIRGVPYYEQLPEAQTKAEAEVAVSDIIRKIYAGRYGRDGREIGAEGFEEFARAVYLPHKKDSVSPLTYSHDEYRVNVLCRHFTGRRLRDITQVSVEGLRRAMLHGSTQYKRSAKPSTVKAYITTLSCILDLAAEQGRITFNPCRKIKWPRGATRSRRDRVLSHDEEGALMTKLSRFPEPMDAARLSLHTGMRKTFILNLKTSHVDLPSRAVRFCGKGGREQRIPLNAVALEILARLVGQATPEGFLFRNRTGNNLSSKACAFQSAVSEAGIQDFHFHDLRHTFATRVETLASAFTVRDLMGHRELRTTNIYVGEKFEEMRRAVDALAAGGRVLAFKAG